MITSRDQRRARLELARCLPLCLTLVACGEPWTPAADGALDPTSGTTVRSATWMSAAEGGTLRAPDGRARLIVPPGAMLHDGEVSLGLAPTVPGALTPTYVVQPEGMALHHPMSIEIDLAGEVAWGRRASAARWRGDGWEELPETMGEPIDAITHAPLGDMTYGDVALAGPDTPVASRRSVVGALMTSGKFAAVTWEDIAPSAAFCADVPLDGCSGSPVGQWRLDGACSPELAKLNSPFAAQCLPKNDAELRWRGHFDIGEGAVVARSDSMDTIITTQAPLSCVGDDAACEALGDEVRRCAVSGSTCRCVEHQSSAPGESASPSSIEGDEIVLSDGAGHERGRVRYCRQGDRLLLEARPTGPGAERLPVLRYVLSKGE